MSAKIEALRPHKAAENRLELEDVIDQLRQSRDLTHNIRHEGRIRELPSTAIVMDVLDGLVTSLFPTHLGPPGLTRDGVDIFVSNTLYTAMNRLQDQVRRGLQFDQSGLQPAEAKRKALDIVRDFAQALPDIRAVLVSDLQGRL